MKKVHKCRLSSAAKCFAGVLAAVFVLLSCSVSAFAADGGETAVVSVSEQAAYSCGGIETVSVIVNDDSLFSGGYRLEETVKNTTENFIEIKQTYVFYNADKKEIKRVSNANFKAEPYKTFSWVESPIGGKEVYENAAYYKVEYFLSVVNEESQSEYSENLLAEDCYIENYKVNVSVLETNEIAVKETVTVRYNREASGLSKVFIGNSGKDDSDEPPLGTVSLQSFQTGGKDVFYSLSKGDGELRYEATLSKHPKGVYVYEIAYRQTYSDDKNKECDIIDFYLNNGTFGVFVNEFDFTVSFPKDFDSSNLSFTVNGTPRSRDSINFSRKENVVTGHLSELAAKDTVRLTAKFQDNYFVSNNSALYSDAVLCGIVMSVAFIFFIMFSAREKKEFAEELIETYEVPENLYAFEADYIHNRSSVSGLSVLLLQLVNEGYIRIEPSPVSKEDCLITKIKEYDGDNAAVRSFADALFGGETEADIEDFVNAYQKAQHRTVCNALKSKLGKAFKRPYLKREFAVNYICNTTLFGTAMLPFILEFKDALGWLSLLYVAVIILCSFFHCYASDASVNSKPVRIVVLAATAAVSLSASVGISFLSPNLEHLYAIGPQIGVLILYYGLLVIAALTGKSKAERTRYGVSLENKILGYCRGLDKINNSVALALSNDDSEYFFNTLPYVYVLCSEAGVDKFVSVFKTIPVKSKKWEEFSSVDEFFCFVDGIVKRIKNHLEFLKKNSG